MFGGCSNIINIDLSSFDTKKVSKMNYMFYNCSKLNIIKINNISSNIIKELEYTNANIIDQFGNNIPKNNYINNNYMMNNMNNMITIILTIIYLIIGIIIILI